mgnify:CR=1 FL=1
MTIQELGTILEYNTDIKIILLNNNFLGNVRQWQSLFFNDRFSQVVSLFFRLVDRISLGGV